MNDVASVFGWDLTYYPSLIYSLMTTHPLVKILSIFLLIITIIAVTMKIKKIMSKVRKWKK